MLFTLCNEWYKTTNTKQTVKRSDMRNEPEESKHISAIVQPRLV